MAQAPTKKQQAQLKKMKKLLSQKISPRMTPAEKAKFKGRRQEHKAPSVSGEGRWAEGATKAAAITALMAALSKTKFGKVAVPALKKLLAKAAAAKVKLAGTAIGVSRKHPKVKQVFPGRAGKQLAREGVGDVQRDLQAMSERAAREIEAGYITPEEAFQLIKRDGLAPARQVKAVLTDILARSPSRRPPKN